MNFLIEKAFFSQTQDRQIAEQQLVDFRIQNTDEFFIQSANILKDENQIPDLRQAAGTLIKGSVPLFNTQGVQFWLSLLPQTRQFLKAVLCEVLMCNESKSRRSSADAISSICLIELPRGEWIEFIDTLAQNTTHTNLDIVKTSIMTLGFICEKFKDQKNSNLNINTIQSILVGIITGMKKEQANQDIKITSIKALRDSFVFLDTLMENEQVRTFVATVLVENCTDSNEEVRQNALQCCVDWVKTNYMRLGMYLSGIFQATLPSLIHENEELAVPAIEIWDTIASEYLERTENLNQIQKKAHSQSQQQIVIPNYVQTVYQQILPHLLNNLTKFVAEDEEEESPIQSSSLKCLTSFIEVLGDIMVAPITNFVSNCLQQNTLSMKQAGILAFTSLVEGASKDAMTKLIQSDLSHFVMLLQDKNLQMKLVTSKLLSKCAELYPDCFFNNQNLLNDLAVMLQLLQDKPVVSRNICYVIGYLAEELNCYPQSPINMNVNKIIESLFANAIRVDIQSKDISLIDCSFTGIMTLLSKCPNKQIAQEYLPVTINQLKNSYSISDSRKVTIQQGILASMHASLISLQVDFTSINGWEAQAKEIYNLIVNHIKLQKDVDSDTLYVIAALSTAMKNQFSQLLDDFWPYLTHALTKTSDADLFKTSIGCLADIARACEGTFVNKIDVMESLLQCLAQQQFDKELKLHVFACIGDIILACKDKSEKYIDDLLKIFDLAYYGVIQLHAAGDVDSVDYAEQLQDRLVETYTCMLHGISNNSPNMRLLPNLKNLFQFLQTTCKSDMNPTVDYCRNALTIIADIYNFYGNQVEDLVRLQFVGEIMEILKRFSHQPENKMFYSYALKTFQKVYNK